MKVSYLHIRNYKQFSDLELDLTYPKGHAKAGEPLDKICIIGQSGTGKTNLLEIIRDKLYTSNAKVEITGDENKSEIYFSRVNRTISEIKKNDKVNNKYFSRLIEMMNDFLPFFILYLFVLLITYFLSEGVIEWVLGELEGMSSLFKGVGISLFRLVAIMGIFGTLLLALLLTVAVVTDRFKKFTSDTYQIKKDKKNYIQLDEDAWTQLKGAIDNYNTEKEKYTMRLSNKLLTMDNYEKNDFKVELKLWENENENILENISNKLNEVLNKFNLELHKLDKNQKSYGDLIFKDLSNGEVIKYPDVSTGTKNLIATFIPLKIYSPKDSIILIDEPEMSFYPDIQRQLVDLYSDVGINNQLIIATHSPLIASSFEPWEIVELKFDKNNQIYRELYYPKEEENHIDNYTVDPRMLTWTSILTDVFDIKEDSNFSFREKKLMEYATLKAEIKSMEDKTSKEASEKIKQFKKLSALLGLQN